jgi:hypothetical protein
MGNISTPIVGIATTESIYDIIVNMTGVWNTTSNSTVTGVGPN